MKEALEKRISDNEEISDFLPYDIMPDDYLASDFFGYRSKEERNSKNYNFLLDNINLRAEGESKRWIYKNFQGYGKHCLDVYLFSQGKKILPSSKHLKPKVGIIKKAYEPEIVKVPVKGGKMSINWVADNNPKRVHAIHGEMYRKGEEFFELINYLKE